MIYVFNSKICQNFLSPVQKNTLPLQKFFFEQKKIY